MRFGLARGEGLVLLLREIPEMLQQHDHKRRLLRKAYNSRAGFGAYLTKSQEMKSYAVAMAMAIYQLYTLACRPSTISMSRVEYSYLSHRQLICLHLLYGKRNYQLPPADTTYFDPSIFGLSVRLCCWLCRTLHHSSIVKCLPILVKSLLSRPSRFRRGEFGIGSSTTSLFGRAKNSTPRRSM